MTNQLSKRDGCMMTYHTFRVSSIEDPGHRCAGLQTTMRCAFPEAEGEHFSEACPNVVAVSAPTSYELKDGARLQRERSEIPREISRVAHENGNAGIGVASRTPLN
ncbi:hypothetical protein ANCDUO_12861 [Ancylostoma duodenale]|uniref:Uncharacterized protein n=1 Tax=Ancylostoma duodenale TaxID=51022 RepID=A0A0C2GDL6_9BILA|nr:hypothetical protein ANCDUO_12861 [Ancylostoma duodenale]